MKILALATLLALSGCASLSATGITQFVAKPFVDPATHQILCCEITYIGGKELATAQAMLTKVGDNYQISIDETGVKAFAGTAIAAGAAQSAASTAGKVAVAAALVAAAPVVMPALGGIAATGGIGMAAVGAGTTIAGQKLIAPATGTKP